MNDVTKNGAGFVILKRHLSYIHTSVIPTGGRNLLAGTEAVQATADSSKAPPFRNDKNVEYPAPKDLHQFESTPHPPAYPYAPRPAPDNA